MYGVIGIGDTVLVGSKNHQIYEFGQLWRLPEGEKCKIGHLLC